MRASESESEERGTSFASATELRRDASMTTSFVYNGSLKFDPGALETKVDMSLDELIRENKKESKIKAKAGAKAKAKKAATPTKKKTRENIKQASSGKAATPKGNKKKGPSVPTTVIAYLPPRPLPLSLPPAI